MQGFTRLEWVVAVAVTVAVLAVGLDRFGAYQRQAESRAAANVLHALGTALLIESARIARNEGAGRTLRLAGADPFALLAERPANHAGAWPAGPAARRPGHWYHDAGRGELVYIARRAGPPPESAPGIWRWRIEIHAEAAGSPEGVRLVPVSGKAD